MRGENCSLDVISMTLKMGSINKALATGQVFKKEHTDDKKVWMDCYEVFLFCIEKESSLSIH